MNRLTHKIALWRLGWMMSLAYKIDAKIVILAEEIGEYEKIRFMVPSQNPPVRRPATTEPINTKS